MNEFMLLMKGDDSQNVAPEEMQQRMQAYMQWMGEMQASGKLRGGQPLEPRGAHLRDRDTIVSDGPFLESKEIIGGYIIIVAQDLDEAVQTARGCPLLEHCEIMVRPLLQVDG